MIRILRELFPPKVPKEMVDFLAACLGHIDNPLVSNAVPQLRAGLLRFWGFDEAREPNFVRFTYRPSISGQFEDRKGRYFRIRHIHVRDRSGSETTEVSIYFSRGLVVGYALSKGPKFKPDLNSVDTSAIRFEFLDSWDAKLSERLGSNIELLNPSDIFDLELNGQVYSHLRDIGDGDCIAMDSMGRFVKIRHDPTGIVTLDGSLKEILARFE